MQFDAVVRIDCERFGRGGRLRGVSQRKSGVAVLQWLRRRQEAQRLAQSDAEALIRDHGGEAYGEARQRERDMNLPNGTTHAGRTPAHWRRVPLWWRRLFSPAA